jgi:hypothetical protein
MRKQNIFLVGFPRSGTTLLTSLLNSHTKICGTPETQFFTQFLRTKSFRTTGYTSQELINHYNNTRLRDLGITENEVLNIANISRESAIIFYDKLLQTYADQKSSCSIIVEKSPEHFKHIDLIKKHFPDAKLVAIVRDPRAAISSLVKTPWNKRSLKSASLEYEYQTHELEKYANDIFLVRYEDLIEKTKQTLESLCHYIGVLFETGMVENSGESQIVPKREEQWKRNSKEPPNSKSLDKWKTDIRTEDIQFIERHNNYSLLRYNYPLTTCARPTPYTKTKVLLYRLAKKVKVLLGF